MTEKNLGATLVEADMFKFTDGASTIIVNSNYYYKM